MICGFRCVRRLSLDLEERQVDMLHPAGSQNCGIWPQAPLAQFLPQPTPPKASWSRGISRVALAGVRGILGGEAPMCPTCWRHLLCPGKVSLAPPKKQTPALLEAFLPPPPLRAAVQPFLFPGAWSGKVQGMAPANRQCRWTRNKSCFKSSG